MSETEPSISDLEAQLKTLQGMKLRSDNLYNLYSIFSSILMEFKSALQDDGTVSEGWSASVMTDLGTPAFPDKGEQEKVESFMQDYGVKFLQWLQLAPAGVVVTAPQAGGDPTADKATADKMLSTLKEFVDPRSVSLDGAVEFVLEYLDSANEKMEDFSRQIGIIKLENTVTHIPLEPIGIPYEVPTRLLFIILQGVFEVMRLISLFGFPGAGLFRIAGSLFGGVIELFKGDWKSALFTFMGFAGSGMMTLGLFGKVVVKVMSFMSPMKQNKLIIAGYESMKSWLIGVLLFVFQTMATPSIKSMVEENMTELGKFLGNIQTEINKIAKSFNGIPEFKCLTIEWPQIWPSDVGAADAAEKADATEDPSVTKGATMAILPGTEATPAPVKKTPKIDFDSLIKLQDLFAIPEFYCNDSMRTFVDALKYVPPARIILELLGMPTTDRGYKDVCWNLPTSITQGNIAIAIIHALRPVIRPKYTGEEEGSECPGAEEKKIKQAAAAAKAKIDQLFAPGGTSDDKLMAAATSIRADTDKAFSATAEAAGKGARQVKESVTKTAQQLRQFMPSFPKPGATPAPAPATPADTPAATPKGK